MASMMYSAPIIISNYQIRTVVARKVAAPCLGLGGILCWPRLSATMRQRLRSNLKERRLLPLLLPLLLLMA
jgi:hypothetical protein